ncbi:MAG: hypothetical protein K8T91_16660 [Planctomycetes bacterium]|nr:hypothetical protein [Planctomycetota bacterium]
MAARFAPRLSIAYLMAWTAITAAILSALTAWRSQEGIVTELSWTPPILASLYGIIAGWILLGSLLILWHAFRRTLWPLEPGEWLLLGLLTVVAAKLVGEVCLASNWQARLADPYTYESFRMLQWRVTLRNVTASATIAVVYLLAAYMVRRQKLWAAAIGMAAPAMALLVTKWSPLAFWPISLNVGGGAILAYLSISLILLGIIHDYRRHTPRHWLHWSAVILTLLALGAVALNVTIGFVWR